MAEAATPPVPASPSPRVPASSPDDARELDLRALGDRARELRKQIVDAQAIVTGLRGELRKTERQIVDVAMDPNARLFPVAAAPDALPNAECQVPNRAEPEDFVLIIQEGGKPEARIVVIHDPPPAPARPEPLTNDDLTRTVSLPVLQGQTIEALPEQFKCIHCGEMFRADAEGCGGEIPGGPTCPKCTPHDPEDYPEHDDSPRTVSLPVIDPPAMDGPDRLPPGPIIPGWTYTPNELGVEPAWVHACITESEIFPADAGGRGGRIHYTIAIGDDDYVLTGGSVRNGFVRCRLQLAYPLDNWEDPVRTWRKALDEADGSPEGAELKGVRVQDRDGKESVIGANIDTIYLDVLLEDLPKHAICGTAPEATPPAAAPADPAKGVLVDAGKWYTFEELGVTPDELWQSHVRARIFPAAPDFKGDGGFIGVPVFVDNEPYAVVGLAMKTNQGEYTLQRIRDAQVIRPSKNWRDLGVGRKVAPEDAELNGMGVSDPDNDCWTFLANVTRIHVQCPRESIPDGREAMEQYARAQARYKAAPSKGPPLEREEERRVHHGGTEGTENAKTIPDLLKVGTFVKTNFSGPYRVIRDPVATRASKRTVWSVTLVDLDARPTKKGTFHEREFNYLNQLELRDGVIRSGPRGEERVDVISEERARELHAMPWQERFEALEAPEPPPSQIRNPKSEISDSPTGPANLPIPEKPRGQSQTWYQWRSSVLGALSTAGVKDVDDIYPTGQALEWYLAGVKPKDAAAKYRASLPKAGKGAADPDGDWQRIKKGIADVLHAPEPKEKRGVNGARPLSFGQWFSTFAATHKATPFSHELPWPRRDDPRVHELWGQYPALRPADAARRFVKEQSANADWEQSKKGKVKT